MDEEQLKSMFAPYGEIIRSKVLVDHNTGVSKGCGFILYSKTAEADWAISGQSRKFMQGKIQCLIYVRKLDIGQLYVDKVEDS